MPAAAQRSLLVLLRPAFLFGLSAGLIVSGVLAIPWFSGDPADPARTSPAAEIPRVQPGLEDPGPEPSPEVEPPLPAAEQPVGIAALVPAAAPIYSPVAGLAGGSLGNVRSAPMILAGVASNLPEIRALAPEHVGATASPSPTLYWFLSGESPVPVEIRLTSERAEAPLLALHLQPPIGAGLHPLRLERHGIRLEPVVIHRWSVALVPDPASRDGDLVSGAAVRRAGEADSISEQLASATPAERAHLLAASGYWYDAFESLTGWIQAEPAAPLLREHRAALLEQVGLAGVAGLLSAPTPVSDPAAADR